MPITARGQRTVARWCGVTTNAISMWILRYDDWPQPVVEIITDDDQAEYPVRGWSPDQRPAWEAYAALKHGQRHYRPGAREHERNLESHLASNVPSAEVMIGSDNR